MTGYGRGSAAAEDGKLSIEAEITSVNRKTLDVQVHAPRDWPGMEQRCTEWLNGRFVRGRVQIHFKLTADKSQGNALAIDQERLDSSVESLRQYTDSRGLPFEPDAALLLQLAKMLQENPEPPEGQVLEPVAQRAFEAALNDIEAMRGTEGQTLADDLAARIDSMEATVREIGKHSGDVARHQRDTLLERLRQLDLQIDLDDERLLKELALHADRTDISEELTRLHSHFQQFREFIQSNEASGRKMDFLCQEIHRELNTTGSKSSRIEITRAVIEAKNALERIREQVQNVE